MSFEIAILSVLVFFLVGSIVLGVALDRRGRGHPGRPAD
jgi:glycerol-3-phosphate acyltransferase PlsY